MRELCARALRGRRIALGERLELGRGALELAFPERDAGQQQMYGVGVELVAVLADQRDRAGARAVLSEEAFHEHQSRLTLERLLPELLGLVGPPARQQRVAEA